MPMRIHRGSNRGILLDPGDCTDRSALIRVVNMTIVESAGGECAIHRSGSGQSHNGDFRVRVVVQFAAPEAVKCTIACELATNVQLDEVADLLMSEYEAQVGIEPVVQLDGWLLVR